MKKKNKKKRKFLTSVDRKKLIKIIQKTSNARILRRSLALISQDSGLPQTLMEDLNLMTVRSARTVKSKYLNAGIDAAIYDRPRSGQPSKITKQKSQKIAAIACSAPPEGHCRWTLDLLRAESERKGVLSISRESIRAVLYCHELKPWLRKMWCIPKLNQEYIDRMEDVLKVYELKYDKKNPVVCIDEKPVQLLGDTRPLKPMKSGRVMQQDYEYKRNGSVNVFCGVEPIRGRHFTKVTPNRKAPEFAKFLAGIAAAYSEAETIHLVMDNLSSHTMKSLTDYYGIKKGRKIWSRFTVHYTPKHASWLNQAEIAIGIYSRQCLGKDRIGSIEELEKRSKEWNKSANRKKIKIDWTFSRKKARKKFRYKTGKN